MTWKRGSPEKQRRNALILDMRRRGATFREIGEAFHLSAPRAFRICKRMQREAAQ